MKLPEKMWKTTIVIWTDYYPIAMELEDLAREATRGDAFCSQQEVDEITDKSQFPDTDFFGHEEDEEDEE